MFTVHKDLEAKSMPKLRDVRETSYRQTFTLKRVFLFSAFFDLAIFFYNIHPAEGNPIFINIIGECSFFRISVSFSTANSDYY